MLQSRKDEDAIENILDSITKDNIELAKFLCQDKSSLMIIKNLGILMIYWRIQMNLI